MKGMGERAMKNTGRDRLLLLPSAFVSKCETLTRSERRFWCQRVDPEYTLFHRWQKSNHFCFFFFLQYVSFCLFILHELDRPEAGTRAAANWPFKVLVTDESDEEMRGERQEWELDSVLPFDFPFMIVSQD